MFSTDCSRTMPKVFALGLRGMLSIALLLTCTHTVAQSAFSWYPNPTGPVRAFAVQTDGRVLVGGDFAFIDGQNQRALARLDAHGKIDPSFQAQVSNGAIHAIAVQPDGRILIGGSFTQLGLSARARIARLNADGSVDAGFNPGASGLVRTLLIEPNGDIIAGGDFTQFAGQPRSRLARVSAAGNLDAGFQPNPSGTVYALARLPDGRIWVGGDFSQIGGLERTHFARLLGTGAVDSTYQRMTNGVVRAIAVDIDDTTLVGGDFTSFPSINPGGLTIFRSRLARIRTSGAVVGSFNVPVSSAVHALLVRPDGDVVVAGVFDSVDGQIRRKYARMSATGELRPALNYAPANGAGLALAVDSVGRVLFGGSWTTDIPSFPSPWSYLLRVYDHIGFEQGSVFNANDLVMGLASRADGRQVVAGRFLRIFGSERLGGALISTFMDSFNPGLNSGAQGTGGYALAVSNNGHMLFGGSFGSALGSNRTNFAVFTAGGMLHLENVATNAPVWSMAIQEDGKVLLGGSFTRVANQERSRIARLMSNYSLDASFNVVVNGTVSAIALQEDGKILIGGAFTEVAGQTRNRLARLHGDGSLDAAFTASANDTVLALAVQADGRILVGGNFTQMNGAPRLRLARLHPDGSVDTGFAADADARILAIATLVNGRMLIAGQFTELNGVASSRLARLQHDGSHDNSFEMPADGSVHALLVLPDGRVMLGGDFANLGENARLRLARLGEAEPVLSSLVVEGDTVLWRRAGPGPDLAQRPQLWFSSDGNTYAPIAIMDRVPGGWAVSGFEAPVGQTYFLRVRARPGAGATSVFEVTARLRGEAPDLIMRDGFES